jgi:hypothetical protein
MWPCSGLFATIVRNTKLRPENLYEIEIFCHLKKGEILIGTRIGC